MGKGPILLLDDLFSQKEQWSDCLLSIGRWLFGNRSRLGIF